jgi:methylmalonyl-CoA mutase cobalamin-binding subunit
MHEFGALLAGLVGVGAGWRVVYLGADLPAAEIARAVRDTGARVLTVSLVHPLDDPRLAGELRALREQVGTGVACLAGGAGAVALRGLVEKAGFQVVEEIPRLHALLRELRAEVPAASAG